ncbi:type II secretion system protein GspE [Egibacter rhizosphaerae]|uniref:Type II secretion system protein GspE n=1 Tax=Egibacter rhizosphaerae TaxID=1670831 RepID=A0A411YLQ6_9ACTN|nr:type II secretion system protein GspE [Egibacter rhizosphaerae]
MRNSLVQLGEILREDGLVSGEDLARATAEHERTGKSLGRVLIELELVTEADLVAALARHLGMDFVDLSSGQVDTVAASLVPEHLARRHCVLPIGFDDDGTLVIAMGDPANVLAIDDVRTATDRDVRAVVATRSDINQAIERYVRMGESVEDLADEIDTRDEPDDLESIQEVADDAPIVKFVNAIISQAVADRASDIHIEPQEHEIRVRERVDGVLHEVTTQGKKIHAGVVSRLKIMAEMDIAERRIPQDGRISIRTGGKAIDLRVSTLPTVHGEKVVMRILDKSSVLLELSDLGFLDHNYQRYEESFTKPYGMILVTGPTGSGKSTTLYATLNVINQPGVNIVTTEDPVEYQLGGISQVQINPKAGLSFPNALRSILRQDPDVVLVGEMRDTETAQIGMEAALTGHLVLSTLHTNDAPSAVTRLTEMGVEPFLVSSSVDCVLAQRLARRICKHCRQAYEPTAAELRTAGLPVDEDESLPTLYKAVGCAACAHTGYRGRLAVHEVMVMSEEIQRLIVERASTEEVTKFAKAQGMRTLREDGLAKALMGQTTLEEVSRVVV